MTKKWWHDKVAYQIYPKSFNDSNGDGIGDIQGIIQKLDYLKDLGIDIIWISPMYKSPFADQGYDIADYYSIDPCFGTMDDMDELIAEAKKRDMYILMDLVVNHCSDEHEWFQQALKDPNGEYSKYFYIEEVNDGKLPCNWRSYFGGSVWEQIPGTNKYYFHAFHKKQPDLNWENPKLREEIYKMMNWWLDRGLAGFRIDAIINIKKLLPWKDYPADRDDGLSSIGNMLAEVDGIGEFLSEMRDKTFKLHDSFSVGEVFNAKEDELISFIGEEDGYFSSMFDFSHHKFGASEKGWYDYEPIRPEDYKQISFKSQTQIGDIGFYSNIIENHDEPRGVSRYIPEGQVNDTSKKMLAGLYFLQKGLPFIYQGQEIGMENMKFTSIDQINDVSTLDEYKVCLDNGYTKEEALEIVSINSRDNARTPMQWTDTRNAGFSTAEPWLVLNPNYGRINVASQLEDETSVLSFYKQLIGLRKDPEYKNTIVYGKFTPAYADYKNLMAYTRTSDEHTLLIIGNFQNKAQSIKLDESYQEVLLNNLDSIDGNNTNLNLTPYQFLVLKVK